MDYLYKKFAKYYDLIYSGKDYNKETKFLEFLIKKYKINGKSILEVGCGTGNHTILLKKQGFNIIGIDLNKEMLTIAKRKIKSANFIEGDMKKFKLKKRFDIIICLFSTMHYNLNYADLEKTIRNFHRHLKPNGLLIFDMGFNKERIIKRGVADIVNKFDNKVNIVRFSRSSIKGNILILHMAYILFKNNKFYFGQEQHKVGIFETLRVKKLTEEIGFSVSLYENYKNRYWNKRSKKYVVFACVKE